ncbi:winged helix-turn-helix transcriptional regulator [Bremerella sp. JC770]|uniref:winged helix-turn-helix transcriptional regulator n=1 Tax=Bremerella sp. JC770 TaxID=3232137 RepID=UPI0034596E37
MNEEKQNDDIQFLSSFLESQKELYETLHALDRSEYWHNEDLLKTSDDEERCARIADGNEFDGNLFRNLFTTEDFAEAMRLLKNRIEQIPRIISHIANREKELKEEARVRESQDKVERPILHANQISILKFLAEQQTPQTYREIGRGTGLSIRTIQDRLKEFEDLEYVFRPAGPKTRQGVTVTEQGREAIADF